MNHKTLRSSSAALEGMIIVNNKIGTTGHEPTKVHFKLGHYGSGSYLEEQRIESATLRTELLFIGCSCLQKMQA